MTMLPLQLAFYKGVSGRHGAVQFNLQRPHYYVKHSPHLKNYDGKFLKDEWVQQDPQLTKDDLTSREGAVFLEIASATGKNVYDWKNKIVMALSINDIGKILTVLDGDVSDMDLMHDPGAKSATAGKVQKRLKINSPKGIRVGCLINIMMKEASGDKIAHTVPLTGDEVKVLAACLRSVIPTALAWT